MKAIIAKSAATTVKSTSQAVLKASSAMLTDTLSKTTSKLGSTPVELSLNTSLPDPVSQLALQNAKLPVLPDLSAVDFSSISTLAGVVPGNPAMGILSESSHTVKLADLDAAVNSDPKASEFMLELKDFLQDVSPTGYVCAPGTKPACSVCPINAGLDLSGVSDLFS